MASKNELAELATNLIDAMTADRAKEILEEVIYNELDGRENLEDLQ